jgi:hypothetical protein
MAANIIKFRVSWAWWVKPYLKLCRVGASVGVVTQRSLPAILARTLSGMRVQAE